MKLLSFIFFMLISCFVNAQWYEHHITDYTIYEVTNSGEEVLTKLDQSPFRSLSFIHEIKFSIDNNVLYYDIFNTYPFDVYAKGNNGECVYLVAIFLFSNGYIPFIKFYDCVNEIEYMVVPEKILTKQIKKV